MDWFRKTFRKKKHLEDLESIAALDGFVQQADDLSINQSKKNIENSLVELTRYDEHNSNGLLITTNGYFITAYHCVNYHTRILKIRDRQGNSYGFDRVCAVNRENDLALAKAKIPVKPEPMRYRFYNTEKIELDIPIALMVYNDKSELEKRFGLFGGTHNYFFEDEVCNSFFRNHIFSTFRNHFIISAKCEFGCSGSPVVCWDGKVIGITSVSIGEDHSFGGIAKFMDALDLIKSYKKVLEDKYNQ